MRKILIIIIVIFTSNTLKASDCDWMVSATAKTFQAYFYSIGITKEIAKIYKIDSHDFTKITNDMMEITHYIFADPTMEQPIKCKQESYDNIKRYSNIWIREGALYSKQSLEDFSEKQLEKAREEFTLLYDKQLIFIINKISATQKFKKEDEDKNIQLDSIKK